MEWNQEIWIPSQIPEVSNCLIFKLMDKDIDGDETVGSIFFDMKEIVEENKNAGPRWENVYGSPELKLTD